jgi:hypothetical protein
MSRSHASPNRTRSSFRLAWLACAALSGACLDNKLDESEASESKAVFIAQNGDFLRYEDWTKVEHETKNEHGGVIGLTTIYVSEAPDLELGAFKIGTILFKSTKVDGYDKPTIHAMVKRGSRFNPQGLLGWEYFELILDKKGVPFILWRGADPPEGEAYRSILGAQDLSDRPMELDGNCNGCHMEGQDGVLGEDVLKLLDE